MLAKISLARQLNNTHKYFQRHQQEARQILQAINDSGIRLFCSDISDSESSFEPALSVFDEGVIFTCTGLRMMTTQLKAVVPTKSLKY